MRLLKPILIATALIELLAIFLRFGVGLESTRDSAWVADWTFGLRIHHGYFGVLMVIVAALWARMPWRDWVIIAGWALILTDLIHHFLVLWPITGDPQFDLVYPAQ